MTITEINHLVIIAITSVAVIIDWRTTKIPNLLTFPGALIGVVFNFATGGWYGALHAVAAWLVGAVAIVALAFAPIGPRHAGQKIGMGDAKLIAAIGAFLGLKDVVLVVFYFCFCYGLLSLVKLSFAVPWKQVLERLQVFLIAGDQELPSFDTTKLNIERKSSMPISLAVLMALLLTFAFRKGTLALLGMP